MAAITHRGITYTLSAGTPTMNLDLQLQGGVDQDETTWISAYPGALTDFAARQSVMVLTDLIQGLYFSVQQQMFQKAQH